ncbi:MAG: HAD-IC family P-type ATPase [Candidatus Methanoplasma sp.]|jgi:cation-transporting ATPase E|nr:HAD-IC family P-type ATPase [Candidatus Methanoplasma sp.]
MHQGLTDAEVRERASDGRVNDFRSPVSRSYFDIVKKNVCTVFNLILFILGVALVYFDEVLSAVSATGVIALNILIATFQEIRAKRRLDKIALLLRPRAVVVRNGVEKEIDPSEIVMDDIIRMTSGDQAQVDGELVDAVSVEMDESAITGESSTRRKHTGDTVYSGTVCVTGEGYYKVTALGADTFTSKMLLSAKRYRNKKTPLQTETAAVTKMLMGTAFVFLVIIVIRGLITGGAIDGGEFAMKSVVVLDIVPVALFLLITITYMIAAVRMANAGVLLQNSNSVESMSHVDTVCMDKTGTITTNNLVFENAEYFIGADEAEAAIRAFAASTGSRNRTVGAIEKRYGRSHVALVEEIQFSSDRKYSAVKIEGDWNGTIFMGAWSSLGPHVKSVNNIEERISAMSSKGLRTVLICLGGDSPLYNGDEPAIPDLEPAALISIRDEVREDCKDIIGEFLDNGMDLKVISGDDPETVNALFALAEIPGKREIISGDRLAELSGDEYREAVLRINIFGRMRPEQKEKVVETLKASGRYVLMVGDGVNDVRPIKAAHVGVALQSGSGAARGVADMVLADDNFAALPKTIIEGKRTVSGMRDILKLYLARNFVLAVLVLAILVMFNRLPLLPVQNAYYALVSVSIAAFLMAIWAGPSDNKERVLPVVLRFAVPSAVLISVFALGVYVLFDIGTDGFWAADLGGSLFESMHSAYDPTHTFSEFMHSMGPYSGDYSEIVSRNAMLLFLVLAGISQIFLICPLFRFMSVDGKVSKDVKPTILALLLFGLVALIYNVPQVAVNVASLVMFPPQFFALIVLFTGVWFVSTTVLLRSGSMNFISEMTERSYDRKLEKEMKEDQGK